MQSPKDSHRPEQAGAPGPPAPRDALSPHPLANYHKGTPRHVSLHCLEPHLAHKKRWCLSVCTPSPAPGLPSCVPTHLGCVVAGDGLEHFRLERGLLGGEPRAASGGRASCSFRRAPGHRPKALRFRSPLPHSLGPSPPLPGQLHGAEGAAPVWPGSPPPRQPTALHRRWKLCWVPGTSLSHSDGLGHSRAPATTGIIGIKTGDFHHPFLIKAHLNNGMLFPFQSLFLSLCLSFFFSPVGL